MSAPGAGGIFISYRRQETSWLAGRLYDRLAARFGDDQVFMDVDTMAPGVDFVDAITQAVSTCRVLLAVIGPQWLTITDEDGRLRLKDPEDIVRLEIATALERDILVIPIQAEGATMPRRQELPEDLAMLARRNALVVRYESFSSDADRLLTEIERQRTGAVPVTSSSPVSLDPPDAGQRSVAGHAVAASSRAGPEQFRAGSRPDVRDDTRISDDSVGVLPTKIDGVQTKITLGTELVDEGLRAFALSKVAAEPRHIWFAENLGRRHGSALLCLFGRGIILRVRKRSDGPQDATLTLRGPEGSIDPKRWRERTRQWADSARIDGDWGEDGLLVSASLISRVERGRIEEVAQGQYGVQRLLSDAQRSLAAEWLLPLDGLQLLGPVRALRWVIGVEELESEVAAELWAIGELRFLELSIRFKRDPVGQRQRLERMVQAHGVDTNRQPENMLRRVLEHLAEAART